MTIQKQALLVVTSDRSLQLQICWFFKDYEVRLANTCADAMDIMRDRRPGVVLLDLELAPLSGDEQPGIITLDNILSFAPEVKVIALTENTERDVAVQVISLGAQDIFHKPIEIESLALIVARAFHVLELEVEREKSFRIEQKNTHFQLAAASSPEMRKMVAIAEKVGPTDIPVLISGESGTGKELFAEGIHRLSTRYKEKFISVNCAAIPEDRIEAELFGVEPGKDHVISAQRIGEIEKAHKGTLFLNNVCALSSAMQTKLLFFLLNRKIYRIGANHPITINTRIISATPQNVELMVAENTFREDLYAHLNGINFKVPALRDRPGDTIFMAQALLKKFSEEFRIEKKSFSSEAIRAIESHGWPGNLREMENKIRQAVVLTAGKQLTAEDLGLSPANEEKKLFLNLKQAREETERRVLLGALTETGSNISDAANLLGVARPTVYKLLQKFHIQL